MNNDNSALAGSLFDWPQRIIKLPKEAGRFEAMGFSRTLPANEVFIKPGDEFKCCYYIKSGSVISYSLKRSGAERDFDIYLDNSLLGESCVFLEKRSSLYFKTLQKTELVCIDREAFLTAVYNDRELSKVIFQSLSHKLLSNHEELRLADSMSAEWRVCNLLLVFAQYFGADYDGKVLIDWRISQQMISDLLGLNRVTTVRIVKALKEQQLIEQVNGLYCVRDMQRLKDYCRSLSGGDK